MTTELRFAHIGMGNVVCANRIIALVLPRTTRAKQMLKTAKEKNYYIDCCLGRQLRSLILLEDNLVMGSAINPKTLMRRLNGENIPDDTDVIEEMEESDEDHRPECEDLEADVT